MCERAGSVCVSARFRENLERSALTTILATPPDASARAASALVASRNETARNIPRDRRRIVGDGGAQCGDSAAVLAPLRSRPLKAPPRLMAPAALPAATVLRLSARSRGAASLRGPQIARLEQPARGRLRRGLGWRRRRRRRAAGLRARVWADAVSFHRPDVNVGFRVRCGDCKIGRAIGANFFRHSGSREAAVRNPTSLCALRIRG
jgi:hypothetical protein